MLAHQATLDYVNQLLQTCSTEEGQGRRYEHNQFADEQGRLNHQWMSLQETLSSQVRTSAGDQTVSNQGPLISFFWNSQLQHTVFLSRWSLLRPVQLSSCF